MTHMALPIHIFIILIKPFSISMAQLHKLGFGDLGGKINTPKKYLITKE